MHKRFCNKNKNNLFKVKREFMTRLILSKPVIMAILAIFTAFSAVNLNPLQTIIGFALIGTVFGAIYTLQKAVGAGGERGFEEHLKFLDGMSGRKKTGTMGSAAFANAEDLKRADLLGEKGFIVGRYKGHFIRYNTPGHMMTFAPTRSGKGVGHVIPNLLTHPGSVVVNDIKGENFGVSGRQRQKFNKVYTFAPFEDNSNCYNPLDFIRVGTNDELDDARLISDMIIVEGNASDPFWDREAKNLVTGLILYVANESPKALRNIGEVRYLLMQSQKDFQLTVKDMARSKNSFVQRAGASLSATEPKILASVLSTSKAQTAVWDSPRLNAITSRSDFDPLDIKREPSSMFLIIPPEYLDSYSPVIRLLTGIMLASMIRAKGQPKDRVLFLIDEFPALGYMQNIEVGIGYLAGYGVTLWMFIQDLNQLKDNYPKWGSFLSNCAVRIAFGTNDVETAKVLSDMMGTTTIQVANSGTSKEKGQLMGGNISKNYSDTSRALMTPDEVMRMPFDTQLIFVQGCKPILAEKIFYFKDPAFKGLFDKWDG
jgi:type IV secretion system protein VirD4